MNKYDVLGIIGEGTYGVVLKCRCKESGEIVAIKKFKDSEANDENLRKTIMREVQMLKTLKHNNIIQLKETFRSKDKLHLVFEYFEKNLLETLQTRSTGLPPELVRIYMYQLACAMNYCHKNNVIHRDIKPENLLINPDHKLKVCDFGFARFMTPNGDERSCPLTDYVATRWYRSPELLVGGANYSFSVDIWSMGCIMGELIDGCPLFPGETEIDQLYIIQKIRGPLTAEQKAMFYKNPNFKGLRFPDISYSKETLERKYAGMLSPSGFAFLKGLLSMDPKERLTGKECLAHEYFKGINVEVFCKEHRNLSSYLDQALLESSRKTKNKMPPKQIPLLGYLHNTYNIFSQVVEKEMVTPRGEQRKTKKIEISSRATKGNKDIREKTSNIYQINSSRHRKEKSDKYPKNKRSRNSKEYKEIDSIIHKRQEQVNEALLRTSLQSKNNDKFFLKAKKENRVKMKAENYAHTIKNSPCKPVKPSDIHTYNILEEETINTMNQLEEMKPFSHLTYIAQDTTQNKGAVLVRTSNLIKSTKRNNEQIRNHETEVDITPVSLFQSSNVEPQIQQVLKKDNQVTTQKQSFATHNSSKKQESVTGSNFNMILKEQEQAGAKQSEIANTMSRPSVQQKSTATLYKAGSNTNIQLKALPKLQQVSNINSDQVNMLTDLSTLITNNRKTATQAAVPMQAFSQVQTHLFVKPGSRKSNRGKLHQNFMLQLHDNEHQMNRRPNTTSGFLAGSEMGLTFQQLKAFQVL